VNDDFQIIEDNPLLPENRPPPRRAVCDRPLTGLNLVAIAFSCGSEVAEQMTKTIGEAGMPRDRARDIFAFLFEGELGQGRG